MIRVWWAAQESGRRWTCVDGQGQSIQNCVGKEFGFWDFPGGPVVKTLLSNAAGSIPDQGAKISHASGPKNQNIKQKQYCNKFNKEFKNGPHQKKKSI